MQREVKREATTTTKNTQSTCMTGDCWRDLYMIQNTFVTCYIPYSSFIYLFQSPRARMIDPNKTTNLTQIKWFEIKTNSSLEFLSFFFLSIASAYGTIYGKLNCWIELIAQLDWNEDKKREWEREWGSNSSKPISFNALRMHGDIVLFDLFSWFWTIFPSSFFQALSFLVNRSLLKSQDPLKWIPIGIRYAGQEITISQNCVVNVFFLRRFYTLRRRPAHLDVYMGERHISSFLTHSHQRQMKFEFVLDTTYKSKWSLNRSNRLCYCVKMANDQIQIKRESVEISTIENGLRKRFIN